MAAKRDRPWYQKCQYFCQICNQSYFSISALRNHTKVNFNLKINFPWKSTFLTNFWITSSLFVFCWQPKTCFNFVQNKHNMDRDTYVSIYGIDAGKVIEDYNCKICNRRVKCEGRSLNSHMRNCHKMSILEYSKK